jgi:uncharacterized protein (TIGR02231 family)
VLEITYLTEGAKWQPQFDVRLNTGDKSKLIVDRGALIFQNSNEDWTGVELILSPNNLSDTISAGTVYESRQGIRDKRTAQELAAEEAAALAEPVTEYQIADNSFSFDGNGLAALYRFPVPVSIRSMQIGGTRLSLNTVEFDPDLYALAVPFRSYGPDAFVTADFTNTSEEPLIAADIRLFLDGSLVGTERLDDIPVGGTATLGFGPVRGLQVTRSVTNKSQGETGLLSVSNQSNELVQIDLNNLSGRDWPVRLQDRVPFSEQDDLKITHTATPPATTENLNRQRGVLEWRFDLPAGQTKQITLETRMQWPDGMELE